ncbi:MAG: DUF11 domain-containing protein, partial [Anaerolineae bacterium]|nr:DUF11 domain-containing protein [Anaerolineae bacterium]
NKQVSDQSLTPGQVISYTIQFGNLAITTTGALITDTLPTGMAFQSATLNGAAITPSGSYVFNVRTSDTATAGQLSAGQSGTLVITATVNAPLVDGITTLQNQVRLTASAATPVTDTATSAVVKPELTILKDARPTLLAPGDVMTYTFTVLNTGNATASNVTISDVLPSSLSERRTLGTGWSVVD